MATMAARLRDVLAAERSAAVKHAWAAGAGLRPWAEVAAAYNRLHPDDPRPMTRSNAWMVAAKAERKLRRALGRMLAAAAPDG